MPVAPYAKLRASINSGAVQTGGITVPASATVQLSADPAGTSGAYAYKYEIYGYPSGFSCPSGWLTDSNGVYYYSSSATPPQFTLPTIANWGKFMLRLTLNNGVSSNTTVIPVAQLKDEGTALSMLSPNGLSDVGLYEQNQFGNTWVPAVQQSLRATDTALSNASLANTKAPVQLVSISNVASLSGEQTIDGVLTSASRVLLTAQSTSSQNGIWLTASGAWTRPTDFNADSQVIVGQTVFVTSGSVYQKTNWQLTSGSTIAGSKTYAQLVGSGSAGASSILPVDAVDTTNNAKSGTSSVDGVSLTAGVSRVLLVNQTTASENGPWLVQSGAWTRPADFSVDSQVIVGSTVYVKSGGTLGGGTSWQLTSGSTISGSKSFSRVIGGNHPAVRVAQTSALPGSPVYSAVAMTITGSAALTTQFDGIGPSYTGTGGALIVGQRVFVRDADVGGSLPATRSGIYTVTTLGVSSYVLTRATDMNAGSDFVGGDAFDVTDGAQYNWTRWVLTTLGPITLDTTSLAWAQQNKQVQVVDLGKKYGIVPGNVDNALLFRQFELDCRASGALTEGVLGVGAYALSFANLGKLGNVRLRGQVGQTFITPASGHNAGETLMMGWRKPPTVYGGTVDTGSGLTPIYLYDETSPGNGNDPYIDITRAGAVRFFTPNANAADTSDWFPFAFAFNFRQVALPNGGSTQSNVHYYSCRGSMGAGATTAPTTLFSLTTNGNGDGGVNLVARFTDATTGAYGAITQLQAAPLVVTANYTQPNVSNNVSVTCQSTSGLSGGQTVYVIGGGYYTVSSVTDSTHVVLTNTGATGNAAPTAAVNVTATTANFTQPPVDGLVTVAMTSTSTLAVGKLCSVVGGGIYSVYAIVDSTHATLRNRGDATNAAPNATVASTAVVSAALLSVVGTSVITGDGTIKPTADYPNVCVWFVTAGTVGVAGITYKTSLDGGLSWRELTPVALGTATSITIQDPFTSGMRFKSKINLAAGTVLKNQVVSFSTSGCDTYYTLTLPAGTLSAANNHEIYWGVDASNKLQLCAGVHGGSWVFASSPPTVHGALLEKPWERFVLGMGCNTGPDDNKADTGAALFILGTLLIQKGASGPWVSPANPVRTHLPNTGTAFAMCLQPSTATTIYDADGTTPVAWITTALDLTGYAVMLPSRPQNSGVTIPGNGIDGIIFYGGSTSIQLSCGPLIHSSVYGRFANWGVWNGGAGVRFTGPCFYNYFGPFEGKYCKGDWCWDLGTYECDMHGTWQMNGCRKGYCFTNVNPRSYGPLKVQLEDATRIAVCLDYCQDGRLWIDGDDENIANSVQPLAYVVANVTGRLELKGSIGSGTVGMPLLLLLGSPAGQVTLDCVAGTGAAGYAVQMVDPNMTAPVVTATSRYKGPALVNKPGKGKPFDGALPSAALPNTTPQTLSWREGGHTLAASTPGGNITINLSDGGELEGTRWPFSIDAQTGATVTFVDVATGNTLATLAAGAARDLLFVHADKNSGGWIRRALG